MVTEGTPPPSEKGAECRLEIPVTPHHKQLHAELAALREERDRLKSLMAGPEGFRVWFLERSVNPLDQRKATLVTFIQTARQQAGEARRALSETGKKP